MYTVPQKIKILKFVGEQGIVTVSDVARHLLKPDKFAAIRITMHQLGISHMKYRHIEHGVWFIDKPQLYELLTSYFPGYPLMEVIPVADHHIPHYLELNRVRITLEQTSQIILDEWWSEYYIRALPASLKGDFNSTNYPDAIFWRKRADGSRQKFFLEYERSLKNPERYIQIFRAYIKRQDVANRNVIYLCHTPAIRQNLMSIEQRLAQTGQLEAAGLHFQFVDLESFYKSHAQNKEVFDEVSQTALQSAVV
ncbi:MAG: replication-relaxation family protein [Candidatus Omnitrophica bacterium]|nr:replication-relaxation family protein [Candidatus Omnitrophota bacterium]